MMKIFQIQYYMFQYIGEGMAIVPLMGVVESLAIGNAFGKSVYDTHMMWFMGFF